MKLINIKIVWSLLLALCMAGCGNDDPYGGDVAPGTDDNKDREDPDLVPLAVEIEDIDFSMAHTYASTIDETPDSRERQVKTDLELYIFDSSGQFYDHLTLPFIYSSTTIHRTDKFEFPSGDWYFYAFVNLDNVAIPEPTAGMNRTNFETTVVDNALLELFYNKYGLVMGTLIGEKTTIRPPSNPNDVVRVTLPVGRMVAKVLLVEYIPEVKGDLQGSFYMGSGGRPGYSIIHEPLKNYLVGRWQGPFRQLGSQVVSPHYSVYQYDEDFEPYPYFVDEDEKFKYPSMGMGTYYYARENTNQTPLTKTTSTFLLGYKYVPAASEIYDINNPEQSGVSLTSSDGSFWVAVFPNGEELIYNAKPENVNHPGFGRPESIKYYESGLNFYKVPIADYTEGTPSLRYAVIRNHSYHLTVKSISRLGNPDWTEVIDPDKELELPAGIEFTLNVTPWVPYVIDTELK